jgi:ATP-dependent protease HslVU (ClpYQ) peptidase subunit
MTCIVALKHGDKIFMGADSAAFKDDEVIDRADKKVFRLGEFLIGFSGSFRVGQIVQWGFNPPKYNSDRSIMHYMVCDFVDQLRNTLDCRGALLKDDKGDNFDADLVVAFRGNIFTIEADFNVSLKVGDYTSSGSGTPYALGALYILKDLNMSPEEKVRAALLASSNYCPSVREPFNILSVP